MTTPRQAALALLNDHAETLTPKAGQFLGQLAVSGNPMTEKQAGWLAKLLERAGLPALSQGDDA
ncbi:hypothetical protein DMC47_16210 [Nostoc sp. 3335mG]|nr:hypothetical protein DMC47_16210 [Nostoc sp. 3335mG]